MANRKCSPSSFLYAPELLVDDPQMKQVMDAAVPIPLNGYAQSEAPAQLAAWLVSEENTHVTGQVVYVDGGAEATLRTADHF